MVYSTGTVASKAEVPIWILIYGGIALDIGVITMGHHIMAALGNRLTLQSPSRGQSQLHHTLLTSLSHTLSHTPQPHHTHSTSLSLTHHNLSTLLPSLHPPGFCIEIGAMLTVMIASKIGVPVSTTHCMTGATTGVGLCNGAPQISNPKIQT